MSKSVLARRRLGVSDVQGTSALDADTVQERDGLRFVGSHLLLDLWGARHLDDPDAVEDALRSAAAAAGARVLHVHLHRFPANGGVSGVVVLAESHISIHTWPERGFAAVDIFMCGGCDPYQCVPPIKRAFHPDSIQLTDQKRGLTP